MIKTILGAVSILAALSAPALADGDASKGERVFKKCKACHDIGEGAKNKVGPVLTGVINRPAATYPDYNYSPAMIEKGTDGLVWDTDELSQYLAKPKDVVPGTKMSFAGLRKESEIEDVIAYLATFPAPQQ